MSKKAIKAGHTIQASLGGNVGLLVSKSVEVALTYGQYGEFGCGATLCTGYRTNIGVGVGITEGYYFKFSDVPGESAINIYTVGWGILSFSYGRVYSSDDRLIGRINGVGVSVSLLPLDVAYYYCDTHMTEPCSQRTVAYTTKEKYYTYCGWTGWSSCSRYRNKTKYKYSYSC